MKKLLIISYLFIFSCKGKMENSAVVTAGSDQTVTADTSGTPVTIFITESNAYCGGARPTEEMYREMTAPRIIPGKQIYIKKDNEGNSDYPVLYTLSADDSGFAQIRLPEGSYIVVDEKKRDRAYFSQLMTTYKIASEYRTAIDSVCLESWYKIPALSFVVEKGNPLNVSVNFHNSCPWGAIPCTQYSGPLPP